jgi:putative aldouronate transport system substrate-binding protein
MLRSRSRQVAGLAAAFSLLVSVAACSSASSSGSTDASAPLPTIIDNPAVTLTMFSPQGTDENLKTNAFTQLIKQKFNITVDWQTTTFDPAAAKEKRQISLASGDLPDVYLMIPWVDQFTQSDLLKLSNQGVILPLNKLIDQYGPNIKKAFDERPEYKAMATAPDGNIYGIPQWVDCFHCSFGHKLWLNSAWLKKLGLTMPKTTEDLREVLRAFKTRDPNGNGKADEVPLSSSVNDQIIPYLMNAFTYTPTGTGTTLVLNEGKVDIQANKDGWREGLRYIRSLYAEGLIDSGAFTQNSDSLKKLGDNASAPILGGATVLHPAIFVSLGQKDGRDRGYDPVPPLTGPGGASYASYGSPSAPGASFVITNKASQAEQIQAVKMLDYIFSVEGEINGMFGQEGKGWAEPGKTDVALEKGVKPLYKQLPNRPPNSAWGARTQYNNTAEFRSAEAVATDAKSQEGYERRLFEATKLYAGKEDKEAVLQLGAVWVDPKLVNELATVQTNIESYVKQGSVQFITGSKSLDTDWDAYVKGIDKLGLQRYLEIMQQAYDQVPTK